MKAKIIKVVEDYPFFKVYYESGVSREYITYWDVPATVWAFMHAAKVYRDNYGCKVYVSIGGNNSGHNENCASKPCF